MIWCPNMYISWQWTKNEERRLNNEHLNEEHPVIMIHVFHLYMNLPLWNFIAVNICWQKKNSRQNFSLRPPKWLRGAKACPFGGSRSVVKAPWGYQAHDMDASHIFTSANFCILMTSATEAVSGFRQPKCQKSHFWGPFWPLLSLKTDRTGRLVWKTLPHSVPGWHASI